MYNAELIFQDLSASQFINEYVEAPRVSTEYRIRLSIEEKTIAELKSPAQRKDLIVADGRLVSPRVMPAQFRTQRQARIEVFQALISSSPLKGTVYIKPQINSRLRLESVFGEYIQLEIRLD